jgi:hypothetical protein
MAEIPAPYFPKNPGDVLRASDWNELQVKAREDILGHRHTGNEDGSLIPRAAIEAGAIDGKLIDPTAEVSVKTLTTSGNLTVKGELAVNGKALLGDIADLLATVKGLQTEKLNRAGDTVSGTLRVRRNLFVDGAAGIGTDSPEYTLDVNGSVRLGGFTEADADEWPRVVWCRKADGTVWDEGLIKHSSQRGFFGRSGIGMHIHESRDWGVWSSGWNPLLGIEGGTGNTRIKGKLEVSSLAAVGTAMISDGSGYAVVNELMASGSLTVGSTVTNYGGGRGWNANTAALMLETSANTEIAVHDAYSRLTSLVYYEGNEANRITVGRDMGWGTSPLVVAGSIGIGTNTPTHRFHVLAEDAVGLFESSGESAYLRLATKEGVDKRVEIVHRPGGRLSLWNNGEDVLNITRNGNVGIGTITPGQKLTVQGVHNASRDPDSGLSAGGQLAIKGNAPQLDFIDIDNNDWGIHVNSNKMYFVRQPWNASDLVLDGNGNVGIGTDAPRQKLDVVGNLKVSGIIEGALHRLVSGDGRYRLDMQTDSNLVVFASDNAPIWSWMTGRISDLSLKKDLSAIQSPLKKLLSLRGVSFAWKDESLGAGREIGVIAQEVEQVFPELVTTFAERKFVNTLGLVPVLIEAIREQQAQIDELQAARV